MPKLRAAWASRVLLGIAVGLAPVACLACRSEAERAQSLEAATMSSAIQSLRAAPHNAKDAPLATLKGLECRHPLACETQQMCVQAYTLHTKALEMGSLLRERLRQGNQPSEAAAKELLAVAEKDLEASKRMVDQCLELETGMLVEARP
jgi:hypothetical protein